MLQLTKKTACLLLSLCGFAPAIAQDFNGIWHSAPSAYVETHGKPALKPTAYKVFTADESTLKSYLGSCSKEYAQAKTISLPMPDGSYSSFRIWSSPMMEAPLAAKYPEITTYTAEKIGNSQVTAKIDYTPFGFHAMVFDGDKTFLVDPYSGKADGAYITYYRRDYSRGTENAMVCETAGGALRLGNGNPEPLRVNGTLRRQYRLALAADSEYCIAVAGANPTKPAVLAKMTTSINRVNGVYERELAVHLVFIANEDTLIFNTTAPDPYTNNSGSTMLNQNQTVVTARVGAANYDIGHVFSTGGGGIAFQGCVCSNGIKARGVTGSPSPVNDAFDIDYVAHEMGHQFGAGHTFNSSLGSCAGNGVAAIAFEPGSGSTIMAYAGICSSDNIQSHSDVYFHSASLEEISSFLVTTGTCPVITASTNTNAVLPAFGGSYNIPFKTPFELIGPTATDLNADTLTYCWEERNAGGVDFGKNLAQTTTDGPLFRSYVPKAAPTRVFPALTRLLQGFTPLNEKLPDVTRTLNFKMTERDIFQGWGCFNFPDDEVVLFATQDAGPFLVTSQQNGETYTGGDLVEVTWDVAGTNLSPVFCSNVDITMSIDGGNTWPHTLSAATSNDGREFIRMPNPLNGTTQARIKVKGTGNVFFNINSGDFTINHGTVGVNTATLEDGVHVSPVPAGTELRVDVSSALNAVSARLLNTVGQEVWSGTVKGTQTLNVAQYPRGVYYLQLSAGAEKLVKTVVLR